MTDRTVRTYEESQQQMRNQRQQLDEISTSLVNFGITRVRKNPIKVGMYFCGLLLCLLFDGFQVTQVQQQNYDKIMEKIDHTEMYNKREVMANKYDEFVNRQGWFWSCSTPECQKARAEYDIAKADFEALEAVNNENLRDAKQEIGIFSTEAVAEAREGFWMKFNQGKRFATNQSKWDLIFNGISAIGKNEKIGSFLLRILLNVLFNFTIGIVGAVFGFIVSLFWLLYDYRVGLLQGTAFFVLASTAALSFLISIIVVMYLGAAGTVYVGAKALSTQLRISAPEERRTLHHLD